MVDGYRMAHANFFLVNRRGFRIRPVRTRNLRHVFCIITVGRVTDSTLQGSWPGLLLFLKEKTMKFWTVSIAVLALAAAALAGGVNRCGVSIGPVTSSKNVLVSHGSGRNRGDNGGDHRDGRKGDGGHE